MGGSVARRDAAGEDLVRCPFVVKCGEERRQERGVVNKPDIKLAQAGQQFCPTMSGAYNRLRAFYCTGVRGVALHASGSYVARGRVHVPLECQYAGDISVGKVSI